MKLNFKFNVAFVTQIFSIIAGALGVVVSIMYMFGYGGRFSFDRLILGLFGVIFSLIIIAAEIYVFDFFKYFAFILTFWGKGMMYLFMGFFLLNTSGFGIFVSIVFFALFLLSLCVHFILKKKGVSQPLLQKGAKSPKFKATASDYYDGGNEGGDYPQGQHSYASDADASGVYNQQSFE